MVKTALVRSGLGLAALGTGVVALWPSDFSTIDPELVYGFIAAIVMWIFSEFYLGDNKASNSTPSPHDVWAAQRIRSFLTDDDITFLHQHDFGSSWWGRDLQATMKLSYEIRQPSLHFQDADLQNAKMVLSENLENFFRKLSSNCQTIGAKELFTLLSDEERVRDHWGKETQSVITEINELADVAAQSIKKFLTAATSKNIVMMPPSSSSDVDVDVSE